MKTSEEYANFSGKMQMQYANDACI